MQYGIILFEGNRISLCICESYTSLCPCFICFTISRKILCFEACFTTSAAQQMPAIECLHTIESFHFGVSRKEGKYQLSRGSLILMTCLLWVFFNSRWLEINHILPFFAFRTEKYCPWSFALNSQARSILMTSGNIFLYVLQKR